MKTVLEYLEYSAAVRPHAVAVEDAGGTATFQELEVGCRKVGSALTERIALREPVAIFLEKGRQALWAFWGTVYAGGFYVPLNPDLPPARLRQIQSVLQANYVIADRAHRVRALEIVSPEAILDVEELLAAPSSRHGWRRCVLRWWTPTRCTPTLPLAPPASPKGWW